MNKMTKKEVKVEVKGKNLFLNLNLILNLKGKFIRHSDFVIRHYISNPVCPVNPVNYNYNKGTRG